MGKISETYRISGLPELERRALRVELCHRAWSVLAYESHPEESRPVPRRCYDRLCPACSRAKAARLWQRLKPLVDAQADEGRQLRFITLTQPLDPDEGPREARGRLQAAFSRLRRRQAWKGRVHAAIAAYEETWKEGRGWHAHAHIIAAGDYWDQASLQAEWSEAVGDRAIVDIRKATDGFERELLKYATKAATLPPEVLIDYAMGMKGARDVTTLGAWHGAVKDSDLQTEEPADASFGPSVLMALGAVEAMARAGDPWAGAVLAALWRHAQPHPPPEHPPPLGRSTG